jgi:hypothetical protein
MYDSRILMPLGMILCFLTLNNPSFQEIKLGGMGFDAHFWSRLPIQNCCRTRVYPLSETVQQKPKPTKVRRKKARHRRSQTEMHKWKIKPLEKGLCKRPNQKR